MAKNNNSRTPVLQQLVVKAPQRKSADVGTWRTALRSADSGRVKTLYDLFDDLLLDGVLSDAMQKRIDAVCNSELSFTNAEGEEVEDITTLIDTLGFEDMLREILKQRFYGRSGFEMEFPIEGGLIVHAIPAKHINLEKKCILINDMDDKGVEYEGDSFICVLGKERDFGLLLRAAPYVIYKRGGFGDWAQWVELFGMPQRVGKYNTYDPDSRKLLEEAFEKAGSAPWVVIPKDSEVETKESGSGSGSSYNEFRQACNEELLITILGQTMTTVQGEKGARSLGEVHKEVEEGKNLSDLRYVQRVLNTYVKPMLAARGFAVEGGTFTFPKAAEPLSVTEIVQLADIIDIPATYLHEKYAIPMPEEGEAVARRQSSSMPLPNFGEEGDPEPAPDPDEREGKGKKPVKNHDHAQRNFFLRLWDFFAQAPLRRGAVMNGNVLTLSEGTTMEERLIAGVANGSITKWSPELFQFISEDLLKGVRKGFERRITNADEPLEYTYAAQDDAFITAMEMNLYRFSAGKTLAEVQALNEAFRESSSFAEFKEKGEQICEEFNRWAETEYNTALLCAEQASNYRRLKSQTRLYPYWEYRTVGDKRVRKEHADLDGLVLHHDNERWKKIFVPNGWGCRCDIVPRMAWEVSQEQLNESAARADEYMQTAEWKMAEKQGWGVNRAETAEIFAANQQYTRKFPGEAHKRIEDLRHYDYGLESFSKKSAAATTPLPPPNTKTAEEWRAEHPTLTDYNGRKVTIKDKVFKSHTTGSHAQRVPLLSCVPDVLAHPDEVWVNSDKTINDSIVFLKFYQGKVMNVVCELVDGKEYRIKTWFEINPTPNLKKKPTPSNRNLDPRWKYRRGLLIKK